MQVHLQKVIFYLKMKNYNRNKHTRKGLTNKKLKEELIIDKEQYKKNQNCMILYCFVYDPDKLIDNPRGFEKDISEKSQKFECKVIISS